jgi:hypothetical protein
MATRGKGGKKGPSVSRPTRPGADPTFPEKQAIAENLGRIVLVWTHVEQVSHVILWNVIDLRRKSEDTRPLTVGQSLDWVWDTTEELLSHRTGSEDLVKWFRGWRTRAAEAKRKRNEAVHAWWLPTGEALDPFKALDISGRKSRKRVREDVVPGGSATLLEWIDELSKVSADQLAWMKELLMPFLLKDNPGPKTPPVAEPRP